MRRLAAVLLALLAAVPVSAEDPMDCLNGFRWASYAKHTESYGHAVLGAKSEFRRLFGTTSQRPGCVPRFELTLNVELPEGMVFEDTQPLLADIDGDGADDIVTVESDARLGSRLTVWNRDGMKLGRLASTPFIGQRHRWMAKLGAADLDRDGRIEIAFVDRPHLQKRLVILRLEGDALVSAASHDGVTNHVFGEASIRGGIRNCDAHPEIVVASADWSGLLALRWDGQGFAETALGRDTSHEAFAAAMECR